MRRPVLFYRFSRLTCLGVLLLAGLLTSKPSVAQASLHSAEPDAAASALTLDLDRFVFERDRQRFSDKVWRLTPQSGRRLIYVPLRIASVDERVAIARSSVKVRKARFIAFAIPAGDTAQRQSGAVDLAGLARADSQTYASMLLGEADEPSRPAMRGVSPAADASGATETSNTSDAPAAESDPASPELAPVPDHAPRLARSITLEPDGTVKWGMDRSFLGAELNTPGDNNLYGYKIDPKSLADQQPDRPQRIQRGANEDAATFAKRRREQQQRDREEQTAFRELRNQVRDLPTEFQAPAPSVIYAVFDAPDEEAIAFDGPAPLPWSIDAEGEALYQSLLTIEAGEADANQKLLKTVEVVKEDAAAARVTAYAVARGGWAGKVKQDDAGYVLLEALAQSTDAAARRVAIYAITQSKPATPVTATLLQAIGATYEGDERQAIQIAALGKLLEVFDGQPEGAEALVAGVNKMLADPRGPEARRVIGRLLRVTRDTRGARNASPPQTIIEAIRFDQVADDQVDQVIQTVVGHAPANSLAARWLAQNLLAQDRKLVDKTLALLDKNRPAKSEPDAGADSVAEGNAQASKPTTIPIDMPTHGLILALSSDKPARQAAAWAALDRFHLAPQLVAASQETGGKPMAASDLLAQVVDQAAKHTPTPATIIAFIENQPDSQRQRNTSQAFARLLAGDAVSSEVKKAVAKRLLASDEPLGMVLRSLDPQQRVDAMAGLLQSRSIEPPLAIGLLADDNDRFANWVVDRLKQDDKPDLQSWREALVDQYGVKRLFQLATSDEPLVRSGAAAALALCSGANTQEQAAFAEQVQAMASRSADEVQKAWAAYRPQILSRHFAKAAGTYRLVITLNPPQEDTADADEKQGERIEVGLVQLQAVGTEIALSVEGVELSASPEALAIRIAKPASLKALESAALDAVPLDQMTQPLDLSPTDGGAWAGEADMRGGQRVRVALEPVE